MFAQGILAGALMGAAIAPAMAAIAKCFKKGGVAIRIGVAGSSRGVVIFHITLSKTFQKPDSKLDGRFELSRCHVDHPSIDRLPSRKG
jgi:CheY-specific phosphatase CheX